MTMRSALLSIGLLLLPATAAGQAPDSDIVDRLVAIVGDSTVLQTQIEEEIQRLALNGMTVPAPTDPEYETLLRSVLDEIVDGLLEIQAAAKDSLIEVDEATIDERVAEQIDQLALQFGGQPALQQALAGEGLTLAGYREILKNQARMGQIRQLYRQARLRNAPLEEVTEDELLARFQEARETLQQRPKLVTFRQVVIKPEPDESAKEAARREAEALLERVNAGEDFAELAEEHSDDLGSGSLGGDVGWFRRGRMVREFEEAAFALLDDEVSPVVESDFGFHIIKVDRSRAGERKARHILIIPEKTEADLARARELADDVLTRGRAGESMTELFAEYSDPGAPDSLTIPFEQIGELPPPYVALQSASTGDFLGLLQYELGQGETRLAVVHVIEVREAGAYTFKDLRGQLASQLQQEKQLEKLLDELRASTYIEIRM